MSKQICAKQNLGLLIALIAGLQLSGCGGGATSGSGGNGGGNSSAPSVLSFTASPTSVSPGSAVQFTWKTQNAKSVSISPGNIGSQPSNGSFTLNPGPSSTTSYTLTAMGQNGATVSSPAVTVTVVAPAAPTVQLSASPNPVGQGSFVTLSWTTTNASAISFSPPVTQEDQTLALPNGSVSIPLQQTTTFVGTVTGAGGTATASLQIQVAPQPTLIFNASPSCIQAGQTSTLSFQAKNATAVTIVDQNGVQYPVSGTSGSIPVTPTSKTTYTATATGASGNATAVAVVNVGNCPQGLANIKHIIFFAQENRAFDMYFGGLAPYRAAHGFGAATDIDSWTNLSPPPVLTGLQGVSHSPFHERTERTDDLTPSWNESHSDVDRPGITHADQNGQCSSFPKTCDQTTCRMDNFMKRTSSIPGGLSRDPNGDRAIGFYDERDLPFYYELASQFATSDRWYSPTLASTIVNRRYLFAATSSGETFTQPSCVGCLPDKTIFDALDAAGVSWKYYYMDSSVFLANYAIWNNPTDRGRVRNISEWFSILSQPNADQLLPDVVFIERGSSSGLDEHPSNNIQLGAAQSAKIINALLGSSAWGTSAFIFTFDEGGGLYDHVPPFPEPAPDSIAPNLRPGDSCAQFNESGFRLPMIVVSPWVKPHFVSHVNRDNTAILKFIEDTFGVAPLTQRDAGQDDMSEFFDFSTPHLLTPPPMPPQPTNGTDSESLETFQ